MISEGPTRNILYNIHVKSQPSNVMASTVVESGITRCPKECSILCVSHNLCLSYMVEKVSPGQFACTQYSDIYTALVPATDADYYMCSHYQLLIPLGPKYLRQAQLISPQFILLFYLI